MRNLSTPSRDECKNHLIQSIYTYNHKGPQGHLLTENDIKSVLALYDLYDKQMGAAKEELKAENLPKSLINTIKKAYGKTYEGGTLNSIRTTLFKHIGKCPICGILPVSELDHHLPESHFGVLAIYTRNLVPLCTPCNKKKLAFFGDEKKDKLDFIHAYFDALPDADFIKATIFLKKKSLMVNFGIDYASGISKNHGDRILRQIEELKLNTRYLKEINSYLTGHAVTMHAIFATGGKDLIKGWLKATAVHARDAYYRNHWTSVLLDALASHDKFIDGGFARVFPVRTEIMDNFLGNTNNTTKVKR